MEEHGYKLLSTEYKSNKDQIELLCPVHGRFSTQYARIRAGHKCPECAKKSPKRFRHSIDEIAGAASALGYTLLDTEYHGSDTKMRVVCPKHGVFMAAFSTLKLGHGCPGCKGEKQSGRQLGSDNPGWKGGVSSLNAFFRSSLEQWKWDLFARANYRCEVTGVKSHDLNVHHMTKFSDIVSFTMNELGLPIREDMEKYPAAEIELMRETFLRNNERMAEPIVMLRSVHFDFHRFCGGTNKPTSFQQLVDFKEAIASGEIQINVA